MLIEYVIIYDVKWRRDVICSALSSSKFGKRIRPGEHLFKHFVRQATNPEPITLYLLIDELLPFFRFIVCPLIICTLLIELTIVCILNRNWYIVAPL